MAIDLRLPPTQAKLVFLAIAYHLARPGSELDPAMFANDEQRIKVRHVIAVGVADFRPLHKSNV